MTEARLEVFRARHTKINIYVTENSLAYNLTGCTLWMTAKLSEDDADNSAVFQIYSPANGITITSAVNGQAQATIPNTVFEEIKYRKTAIKFDIQLKTATSEYYTIASGTLEIKPNITRTT